jgi:pyridoxamine 5'-phosphate oxidase
MHNLHNIRKDYGITELDEKNINLNPFIQFSAWMDDALSAGIPEPTAMILSTVSKLGKPSSRVVLLKHVSEEGFCFFSNYESRKSIELKDNANASVLFFWKELERQVRIEGTIIKTTAAESDDYFFSRPVKSQVSAWASPQSKVVPNRKTLKDWFEEFEEIFEKSPIKRPPNWGGFRLVPDYFEFWQGRENRLHDRIEYKTEQGYWVIQRLAP